MSVKTLLIGLDGATFSVLDPLLEQGHMPFLKSFLAGGIRAGLRTIVPPLTPPAWTSLMTGRTPGQHGVFDFFRMESDGSRHIRFFNSNDVQCDTIWSLASNQGLRVTALNFPAMFPAPKISGHVVPGWVPWKQLRLACWPEGLLDRLKSIPGFNQRELAMDIKLEEKATEGCSDYEEYAPWIELHIRREQNWFAILRHLVKEDPSELTAILFDGVDKLQHLCWRFLRPEDDRPLETEQELRLRELCLEYFRKLDTLLEQLCDLAGPEATVLMASDHGFGPTYDVFHVNAWLEQRGYLAWSDAARSHDSQGALLGVGQVARHTWLMDWNRTKAFAATPTSNGIYILVNRDGNSPGIDPSEYHSFRERLKDELLSFRDAPGGAPVITGVWTRDEAFSGPHCETAPDLTLMLRDGGLVGILPSPRLISRRPIVGGAHRPVGVFAARGPNLRRGMDAGELSILDVAPTVLYSLGLPLPLEMQGRLPEEIFEGAAIKERPVLHAAEATVAGNGYHTVATQMTEEDEQIVMERLRELGYVE
ncbi:MAG: type phosphodiesterase/nucleotide pyrophosphatase [Bryobacterales bacterium]|nr:type phosphodiesterase/nucleotide pyrophosphatase [Bryobacterales bacterium]